jgi:hypothetical protein
MTRSATRTVNPALAWAPALIVSALVHAMMVAVLKEAVEPDPIPFTEEIRTRIKVSSMKVPAHRAEAQEAESQTTKAAETGGDRLGVQTVPSSRARSVAPAGQSLAALAPKGVVAPATRPAGEKMPAAQQTGARLPATPVAGPRIPAAAAAQDMVVLATIDALATAVATVVADTQTVTAAESRGPALATADLPATEMAAATAPAQTVAAAESHGAALTTIELPAATMAAVAAPAQALASEAPRGLGIASVGAESERLASTAAGGQVVAGIAPAAAPALAADPQATQLGPSSAAALAGFVVPTSASVAAVATTAALAWTGETNTVLDEKSLAAIQSFMQPSEVTQSASFTGSVRDGIGDALAQFPCSRLQAAFQPETGGLEIRGHVPVPALQKEVVAMLGQAVGGAIPIAGSVLVLPAPQCGVLDAVEGLGFPQSKDQENDPLEVGREAQAQLLSLEEGQKVVFSLQAPEFDAHIYLDYYDKDGNVVHVLPNQYTEDNRHAANARFAIGEGQGGGADFEMRVTPPFSQDVAIVLGATRPLYEGLRPLAEDAAGYLSWLHGRIDELRAEDPDFRGEWVYLFVRTGPRGAFVQ